MKPIILCDIDGTIALRNDRDPYDLDKAMEDHVNWPIVKICHALYTSWLYDIVVITARGEEYRVITEYWLYKHNIFPYRLDLLMRPLGDNRPDEIVKWEMFGKYKYNHLVWAVLDDRDRVVKMWRDHNITCLQVAEGDF